PAVERGIVTVPGGDDIRYETFRYFQPMEKPVADDPLGGLDAEPLQLRGCQVQSVDFGGSETVTGRLVPVGLTVDGMVGHAVLLDQLFPPRAWCQIKTLHVHLREKRGSSPWSRSRRGKPWLHPRRGWHAPHPGHSSDRTSSRSGSSGCPGPAHYSPVHCRPSHRGSPCGFCRDNGGCRRSLTRPGSPSAPVKPAASVAWPGAAVAECRRLASAHPPRSCRAVPRPRAGGRNRCRTGRPLS